MIEPAKVTPLVNMLYIRRFVRFDFDEWLAAARADECLPVARHSSGAQSLERHFKPAAAATGRGVERERQKPCRVDLAIAHKAFVATIALSTPHCH